MITEFVAAWIAVSDGISPSMVLNVSIHLPLMALLTFKQITADQITTYIRQLRLEDVARESPRDLCGWESKSETAWEKCLGIRMLILDITP